jgi:hypothetical protein
MGGIPPLPIAQPVPKPLISPGEMRNAGLGAAVELNEQAERMTSVGMELEERIIQAKRQLEVKQGEIAFDKYQEQTETELGKTVSTDDVDALYEHYQNSAPDVMTPYSKDPRVAQALNLYAQSRSVDMQRTVNARKSKIITDQDLAANELKGDKSTQDWKNAFLSGGDVSLAEGEERLTLQSSVLHGTMTQERADAKFQEWLLKTKKSAIAGMMYSPDPIQRRKFIDQLKSGNVPKELAGLDKGFLNQALASAEEVDKELTAKAETQNLNASLDRMYNAFNAVDSVYKDDPNAQSAALKNPEFLKSIGALTTDPVTGKQIPNWRMAKELDQYVTADAATQQKAYETAADKEINAISDDVVNHKYGEARVRLTNNLPTIEKPEKYKGLGARLSEMIQGAANRVDEDIPPHVDLAERSRLQNEILSGEHDDSDLRADIIGSRQIKEASGKELLNLIPAVRNKIISEGLKSSNNYLRSVLAPSKGAIFQALLEGGTVDAATLKNMNPVEQLEFGRLTEAEEELTSWTIKENQLAASGKRSSLTHEEIFKQAQEIAKHYMPTMEQKLDAIHQSTKSGDKEPKSYKLGDLYEGKKIIGINPKTRKLNVEGVGVVAY